MNWRIRVIKWLVNNLREDDDFKLRLAHSLVLQEPKPELYMEVLYGDDDVKVFNFTFDPDMWVRVRAGMAEVLWRVEREYEPLERE